MKLLVVLAALLVFSQCAQTFYEIPKILWTFWDTGFDSARLFTRMCINNMAHYSALSGWEFRFLSNENYTQFITPESLQRLDRMYSHAQHKIGRQHWADLMRLFLVYENGGMWLDTNSFFLGNFTWIENIAKEKWVINRLTPAPEIITFSLSTVMGGNSTVVHDEQLASDVYLFPGVEIWSFISKPKSKFLTDVLDRLEYALVVQREVLDEQTAREQLQFGREKDPYYITSNYVFQTVLQKKQRELEALPAAASRYAVQHYQMWNIPAENTIYGVFSAYNWFTFNVIGSLISEPLAALSQRYDLPAYFIKFNGGNYPHINNALVHHEFAGCLGVDVRIREGSLFEEFMMRHSRDLPEIKHIAELYELGYMKGDCDHYGSLVQALLSRAKLALLAALLAFLAGSALLMRAVKRRIVDNNRK